MAKCVYCHEKKGKRACPALRGEICSACCGEFRITVIHCPDDCIYLSHHEGYQRERVGNRFLLERRKFIENIQTRWGREGIGILNFLDTATFAFFNGRPAAQDNEVLLGFQSLRRVLSPLEVPGNMLSAFGEFLWKELEPWLKKNPAAKGTASEIVGENIEFLKTFSGNALQSNRYLKGLIGFTESHLPEVAQKLKALRSDGGKRIILPEGRGGVKGTGNR